MEWYKFVCDNVKSKREKCKDEKYHGAKFETIYAISPEHLNDENYRRGPLVFELDGDKDSLEQTLFATSSLIRHLIEILEVPRQNIKCYFSGNRGFHVEVHGKSFGQEVHPLLPRIHKACMKRIVSRSEIEGLESLVDYSVFDMGMGHLLRRNGQRNEKGNLFKIRLPLELEHLSADEIRERAKSPANGFSTAGDEGPEASPILEEMFNDVLLELESKVKGEPATIIPEGLIPPCVQAMVTHAHELKGNPSVVANWNKISSYAGKALSLAGLTEAQAIEFMRPLVTAYQSNTYVGQADREKRFLERFHADHANDPFKCSFMLGMKMPWFDCKECPVKQPKGECALASKQRTRFTAAELSEMDFPPMEFIVQDILPEGLCALGGVPKAGKSWFCYHLCLSVANGTKFLGHYDCIKGDVLYLALEDGERRLKERLMILGKDGVFPENLTIDLKSPRLDEGGAKIIEDYICQATNPRLIVIDTWEQLEPTIKNQSSAGYKEICSVLATLQVLALQKHIAIVVVTHLKKSVDEADPFAGFMGSTAYISKPDTLWALQRTRGEKDAFLAYTGRDIDSGNIALTGEGTPWVYAGTAHDFKASQQQAEVLEVLVGEMSPGERADALGIPKEDNKQRASLSKNISRWAKTSKGIEHTKHGKYKKVSICPNTLTIQ